MVISCKKIYILTLILTLCTAVFAEDVTLDQNEDTIVTLSSYGATLKKVDILKIENGAKIVIDGSRYNGGSAKYEIFQFNELSGLFAPENIEVTSFKTFLSARLEYGSNSINLVISSAPIRDSVSDLWFSIKPKAGASDAKESDLILNNGWAVSKLGKTNNVQLNGSSNLSCKRSQGVKSIVYSIVWDGNDFDLDGERDILSFDLKVEGYSNIKQLYDETAKVSSILNLGAASSIIEENNAWGVSPDGDFDESEGVMMSIQNVDISISGYNASVSGFNKYRLLEKEPEGEGHKSARCSSLGGVSKVFKINGGTTYDFDYLSPLIIASMGSEDGNGFQLSNLHFHLKVHKTGQVVDEDPSDYSNSPNGALYTASYPAQKRVVMKPEFSWERVPRWLAVRSGSAYEEWQMSAIVNNYQLVMLEKSNQNGEAKTELGIAKMAKDLKARDSKIKILSYWNANFLYRGYEASNTFDVEKWSSGSKKRRVAHPTKGFNSIAHKYDQSIVEMQDWWINIAGKLANDPNIDGIFIDSLRVDNVRFFDDSGRPYGATATMLNRLKDVVPSDKMIIGNCLKNYLPNGNRQMLEFFDGSYLEGWDIADPREKPEALINGRQKKAEAISNSIQMMREALSKGKVILFQYELEGRGDKKIVQDNVHYPLAVYLMVAEENAFFGYNMGVRAGKSHKPPHNETHHIWDTSFLSELNRPLGKPLGPLEKKGFIYTRSFEHLKVTLNLETRETIYEWALDADSDGVDDELELKKHGSVFSQ